MPETHFRPLSRPTHSQITIPRKGRAPLKLWWLPGQPMDGWQWMRIPPAARLEIPRAEWPEKAPELELLPGDLPPHGCTYVAAGRKPRGR
ncbi:hypothetical protein [Sediminicoccus rosea]|jgi:hypothetical protein|uniref:Uncharacterized protein n=1 Tax=Sediminicoccus rosea TaxID=1225128 RepID=A0ABZ0PLP9_9PROT|nr:hypothetical protein [Sediminicoccus rosea]WPB86151.1 hypothetical protein R9Z33_04590 [Sediminicoccus rosea]